MNKASVLQPIEPENERLAWLWACCEQLALLNRHDAAWIQEAKNGWEMNEFKRFLRTYSLQRGKHGKTLVENAERFRDICNESFSGIPDDLQAVWEKSIEDTRRILEITARSACLKAMWYYHPHLGTMYDSYVQRGLASYGYSNNPKVFFEDFNNFVSSKTELIERVVAPLNPKYPYPKRLADKFLWLAGYQDRNRILRSTRISVQITHVEKLDGS
ncbi:hypothetical protein [Propylenella binzhouense]|uniref:Uncharacterized protein n=1 Tax=Propylenella binzhouense TaxID=2555902 RepID=A0A964T5W9_9HYPH|nr:hypothetical protein [Propylenella binzhouense]MYZ49005.1 hypothetical protein [Propylenella binzhouense]